MKDSWETDVPTSVNGYQICRRCGQEIKTPMVVVIDEFQIAYCLDRIGEIKEFNPAMMVE